MPAAYLHGIQVVQKANAVRNIRTVNSAVIGVVVTAPDADPLAFPLDTPVAVIGDRALAAKLDTTGNGLGTGPMVMDAIFDQIAPLMVVVRVAEDVLPAVTQSNIIGTVTATGQYTGMQALLTAQSKVGLKPRVLGAPGFTAQPVHAAMDTIATALRGFAYYDMPSTTADQAVIDRAAYGNRRSMLLWPAWEVWDTITSSTVVQSASARALGLRAKIDNDIGWHKTLSNIAVNGVTGISKPVQFELQDPNSKANFLNANEITTMVRQDGFRFWGSRTPSVDPVYAFESAVRTDDILADTIAEAHFWAMDKPMSTQLFEEIVNGINAKFRELAAFGYIVNAQAWLDNDLNTNASMSAGKLWINYEHTPVPPLEQLGFQATITNKYLIELLPGKA